MAQTLRLNMRHYTKPGTGRTRRPKDSDDPPRPPGPPVIPAGTELAPAVFEFRGSRVKVRLRQPGWQARSDQVAALIDGEWCIVTARALASHMAGMLPRQATRRQMAETY